MSLLLDNLNSFFNNPMTTMGLSVLSQADKPAQGLLQGGLLANRMEAQRQQNKLAALQQQQAQLAVQNAQRQAKLRQDMQANPPSWLGQQNAPFVPELFPGETADTLSGMDTSGMTSATGMYATNPQLANAMGQLYQYDPIAATQTYAQNQMSMASDASKAQMKYLYDLALEEYKQGQPVVVGKNSAIWIPGQGFISPTGVQVKPELDDVLKLKKQAQPRVNAFRKVAQQGEIIRRSLLRSGPFSDVQSLVAAVKILDPESVVREGEVALPRDVSGPFLKLQSLAQQAQGAGFLPEAMKRDMAGAIDELLRTYEEAFEGMKDEYSSFDRDYGVPLYQVLGPDVDFADLSDLFPATGLSEGARSYLEKQPSSGGVTYSGQVIR